MRELLNEPELFIDHCVIGAKDVTGTLRQDVLDPASGDVIGSVPHLGEVEAAAAVEAAAEALPAWQRMTALARGKILHKWGDLILQHAEDLARIVTMECGKPLVESRSEVTYTASFFHWFAGEAPRAIGATIPAGQPDRRILVSKTAAGVTAAITPWNFPLACVARKVAAALAAGCTQVIKPAPQTPFSAFALAALGFRAGVPRGVINVVTGDAPAIGSVLTSHPEVRVLSFTGSTAVGKILASACGSTIKRTALELGGNAAFIIFDDADVEAAADEVIACKFRNAGQTCVCANRILVQDGIYPAFVAALRARMEQFVLGPGMSDDTTIGPLIDEAAVAKVERHVEDAKALGARVTMGGERSSKGQLFFEPTIIEDATEKMQMAQEETFGPVASLYRFSTEEEAVALANRTPFGLASYLCTENLSRAHRAADAIDSGMVGVNTGILSNEVSPFGGVKQSGIGREGSIYGMDEFLEIKSVQLKLAN